MNSMKDNKVAPVPAANEPLKPLDPDGLRQRTAPVSDAEAAGKIQAALRGKKGRENVSEKRANVFEGTMKKMGHQINNESARDLSLWLQRVLRLDDAGASVGADADGG